MTAAIVWRGPCSNWRPRTTPAAQPTAAGVAFVPVPETLPMKIRSPIVDLQRSASRPSPSRSHRPPRRRPCLRRRLSSKRPRLYSKQEELDAMLAPIALYPDALLSQMMMASTYPLEIVEAARWQKNAGLKDKALDDALLEQPWDASVKSLCAFPDVLTSE